MSNPGSAAAKRLGCTCPVLDNAYGEGAVVDGKVDPSNFFLDPACPIHQDRRKLDAERRGEGDSDGDAGVQAGSGDDSGTSPEAQDAGLPLGEGTGVAQLQSPDERGGSVQGGGKEEAS